MTGLKQVGKVNITHDRGFEHDDVLTAVAHMYCCYGRPRLLQQTDTILLRTYYSLVLMSPYTIYFEVYPPIRYISPYD